MRPSILCLLCLPFAAVFADLVEYRVSVDGVLDNREFGRGVDVDRTFFFVRSEAEIGARVGGRADSAHRIWGGLTYLQEFGARGSLENLNPLMYYYYGSDRVRFRFGAFPRSAALDVPEWFFGGEAAYYRPFVHGAAVWAGARGFEAGAWVDWTGRQSETVNEAFLFGGGVKFNRGIFSARHDFLMYHHALTSLPGSGEFVLDNGGVSAEAIVSWGRPHPRLDTLSLSVGGIVGLDRDRGDGVWHTPAGGVAGAYAGSGFLAIRGLMYVGEPQPLRWTGAFFSQLGAESYGRLDLIAHFVQKDNIRAELFQSIHFVDGDIGYSQHFLLNAEIGSEPNVRRKKRGFRINARWD